MSYRKPVVSLTPIDELVWLRVVLRFETNEAEHVLRSIDSDRSDAANIYDYESRKAKFIARQGFASYCRMRWHALVCMLNPEHTHRGIH